MDNVAGVIPLKLTLTFTDPGDHGRCERGRNEKQDGYREERKGERLIDHGYIGQGLRDERQGQREVRQGQRKECRNGGRC